MTTPRPTLRATSGPRPPRTISPVLAIVLICLGAGLIGLAAANLGIIVIAGLLAGIAALLIAVRPDSATLLVIVILYSNAAAIAVQRYDVPYFAGAAFPLLLVVPFAYHIVIRRQPIIIASGLPWMLGYFIIMILGTVAGMSADPERAMDAFTTFIVEGLLIYTVMTNVVRSLADLRLAVWALLLVGGVLGALSVHQQATGNFGFEYGGFAQVSQATLSFGSTDTGGDSQPRLAGPIGEKNRYAQIMVVLLPLGLFRIWGERRLALKILAGVATALIVGGAVFTFSRGAALGIGVTIVLMVFLRYIKPSQLVAMALGVAVLFTLQPTYLERLMTVETLTAATSQGASSIDDSSFRKRANETIAALLVFADHPVLGVGRGLFPVYYGDYVDEVGIAFESDARQAHNLYAGMLAEVGVFGFVAFVGIFGATLWSLAKGRRRTLTRSPAHASMATAFFLAVVSYLTTGMFLHLAYERYLWILLALAGSAAWVALNAPLPTVPTGADTELAGDGPAPNGRNGNGSNGNGSNGRRHRPAIA